MPGEQRVVAALVVLKDGKRLAWKASATQTEEWLQRCLSLRYFAGHDPKACELVTRSFGGPDAFDAAEAWCATHPAHPDEPGRAPQSVEVSDAG